MARHLNRKVGEMEYDKLIAGVTPPIHVSSGTIRKLSQETDYKRGTVFAKSSVDGKLVILGTEPQAEEILTPDCVLTDDVVVGTEADIVAPVYTAGCFNVGALIFAEGYTLSEADKDKLRERGLYLGTVLD